MLYIKKYFTEGLIQMAILLSLCGVRVDVGLEPYLPSSWHERILGPSLALTQTQFHNLRNSLEDGYGMHPKNVDLDSFFTARRLLGWVHSLNRLQVPHAELETWLLQREPDPPPMGYPDQASPLERVPTGEDRDRFGLPVEPRGGPGTLQEEELNVGVRGEDLEPSPAGREPYLSSVIPTDSPSVDLELDWQDLFSIMEPENKDDDMMTSSDQTPDSRWSENCNNLDNVEADQGVHLMETPLNHGLLGSLRQPEQTMLTLAPSAELDDPSSAFSNSNVNTLHSPPDHTDLLAEDFSMGLNAEDNLSAFNMNLLMPDLVDSVESSPCVHCVPHPEHLAGFDVNCHSCDITPSSFATSLEGNDMTQEFPTSPSSLFLVDKEEDFEDEDDHPLDDLLDDVAMLDDIRLLDLALDEGFSPEMGARLKEEGYLDREGAQQKTDDHSVSGMAEDQSQLRRHQQDGEDEAYSDSGLSLDFSHSPASPCVSEASSYSSSSSSSSDSSSSCLSAVGSPFSRDKDYDAEEGLVGSDMEVEIMVKQEEEEEEMGAVGGWYPKDVKKVFPANYEDHKLFNDFSWQEDIDHDHTYNQPWFSASSPPSVGKMPSKHTKSPSRHGNVRPYPYSYRQIAKTDAFSRDEWHAQALKIPFSNELIVNLPVEDFNDLLTNFQLNEDQLTLIRDIRRRGKNKIAAQNCRKRKLDVLLGLEDEVSCLRRHRLWLLQEKQEARKKLQEMKRQLDVLYQEVFSRLRDENGRPLDTTEYLLQVGPSGNITVASHQQDALLPMRGQKNSKKQRGKKK